MLHVECKEHFSQHFRILPGAKARCVSGPVICNDMVVVEAYEPYNLQRSKSGS